MKICGIYKITNLINRKVYIGQSLDINKRISNHKYKMKNNRHNNLHLQSSFNKYGLESFSFEIIECCQKEDLNKREMHWISLYKSYDRVFGYNIQEPSENSDYKVSNETKLKIINNQTKYSDDELLEMIVNYFKKHNKIPSLNEFTEEYKGMITGDRVKARFNGFRNAVNKSGVYNLVDNANQTNGFYSRELLLKFLKNWIEINGKSPTQNDINKDINMPSIMPYLCEFKSLNNAIEILGYKPRRKKRVS